MQGAPVAVKYVGEDGVGTLEMVSEAWTVGDGSETDLMGLALIVHAGMDDFGQPLGNAGERIGCGVIQPDPD